MAYKDDIKALDTDLSASVTSRYSQAKQQLQQVRTANLEGPDRALPTDLGNKLDNILTEFTQEKPKKLAELTPKRDMAKKKHLIFTIIQWVLLVIGVILLFKQTGFGVALIIVALICHFVFKSLSNKEAKSIADEWSSFMNRYSALFGDPESLHSPATGLYKEVDDLYLKSLDDQARGFEIQRREMKKQMDAQNEQHQQSMAMQQQQLETLKKGMDNIASEQHRTNVGLFKR